MPEQYFRYVPTERASTWEQAGWNVISPPLSMQPPLGLEGGDDNPIEVVIVEWQRPEQPVEPSMAPNAKHPSGPHMRQQGDHDGYAA
jgi:hypothetical protein